MRTLITAVILLLIGQIAFAQKNFEGRIVYKMSSAFGYLDITVYFGNEKLLAISIDSASGSSDEMLFDFSKGIVNNINRKEKTYRTEDINTNKIYQSPLLIHSPQENKKILGYNCSAYKIIDTAKNGTASNIDSYIYYADSLPFQVNEKYVNSEMIPMLTNGKNVSLGCSMGKSDYSKTDFGLIPVSVTEEKIPDSIFSLAGFTIDEINITDTAPVNDSAVLAVKMAVDSVMKIIDSVEKEAKRLDLELRQMKNKKSPSEKNHTQPNKSSAAKPKE